MHEYDLIAEWYASQRSDQTGVAEVRDFGASLVRGSRVLDIGCGNGIPITRALLECGHKVVPLDSSSAMIERFQNNFPDVVPTLGTIQRCSFADHSFDAAVAWGVMFHLTRDDQKQAIANVSRMLKPGALFLFTSGDVDGFEGKEDTMNGVVFTYYSYSVENYRRILAEHSLELIDVHEDAGKNTYYLAKKR